MTKYDLAIIGSGPCGYVAGIRAAQLGLKTCIFEKDRIGGVCLNWGCIPTKALSASAIALYNIERASEFGINVKSYDLDFAKVYERKENIVKKLSMGVEMLLKARKLDIIKENAQIKSPSIVKTANLEIEAKNILIAAGSVPFELPGILFDHTDILSSTDILELKAIPKSLIIVGGGVIGCEFASIFRSFGSEITIIEAMSQLLPNEDEEIARKLEQLFKRRGIKVLTNTKIDKIDKGDKAFIAVGRSPNSKGLGLEALGVECNKGWIKVNENFRTNVNNIYAAGDIKGGMLLAHVASKEGIAAVEHMAGNSQPIDYNAVPSCIFTNPEIASVGLNKLAAKNKGIEVKVRKFLFSAIGKAHVLGETDGFIKLVTDSKNDKIVGCQIIGPHATGLIAEISPCIQFGITSEKLASVIHAHPTLSEIICEVSEAVHNKAIHSL
ncbi:MAG: dihydrolipoyl dehydrogenase [Candidatus Omnitrophica bacterium CG_4_9_14_0_2_um_filter_42_8]|nr:MAG: dihydrolipoyl dehydrogenase [Candidatus Omnitrophica bacterium CG22_combo_CG10-13_8_21_14_all_43_16]PJC47246.1 MAG: dihydrolipoyl dehydrogenase [Candidatus Omnitrophica bacterium CG_4_9_14_0_2_um_filter_42_8]